MSTKTKRIVIGLALLATLLAAWFAPTGNDDGLVLSERTQRAKPNSKAVTTTRVTNDASSAAVEVLNIRNRTQLDEESGQDVRLFASNQWAPSIQKASANATKTIAPSPPKAPPLPFRVLGRYDEAGQAVIFLQHLDQNLAVRVGDTVAEQYKVVSLQGSTLTLRFLPLNQSQTLEVGGAE